MSLKVSQAFVKWAHLWFVADPEWKPYLLIPRQSSFWLMQDLFYFFEELMKCELFSPEDKFYWKYVCLVDEERLISVN